MSVVTDVIVTYPLSGPATERVNNEQFHFTAINDHAGGNKRMQGVVLAGAFNFLSDEGLLRHLKSVDWGSEFVQQAVQVWLKHEEESTWTVRLLTPDMMEEETC